MNRFVPAVAVLFVICAANTVAARDPYLGASVFVEAARASGSGGEPSLSGDAFGGAVRVGTELGKKWGVDFELGRTAEIVFPSDARILTAVTRGIATGIVRAVPNDVAIFPPPDISGDVSRVTVTALLSRRQEINERFSLLYLGGLTFTRATIERRITSPGIGPAPFPVDLPRLPQVFVGERVAYSSGPAIGLDGRIGMTDHLLFVPGLRLMAVDSSWLLRPSLGVHWTF